MKPINLWKTAVIATKMKISDISIEIENLFFADQLNTPAHVSLKAERAELNANLKMLFDIKSFVGA